MRSAVFNLKEFSVLLRFLSLTHDAFTNINKMDLESKLIEIIQHYTYLYDKQQSLYKDRSRKEQAWQTIANALNTTVDNCMRSWKNLREHYAKERRGGLSGSGASLQWEHYERMSFMARHILTRKRTSNFGTSEVPEKIAATENVLGSLPESNRVESPVFYCRSVLDDVDVLENTELLSDEEQTPPPTSKARTENRRKSDIDWKNMMGQALADLANVVSAPVNEDRDVAFGASVGFQLKHLPEEEKNLKKSLISTILYANFDDVKDIATLLRK